ncbi:hypothetical protein A2313_00385 [Candidatus Roizmanbacteria bacterium RIFOXYB2_FULL_41_10]|nr:MAG: hypothetical protein A2262_01380 [Candidatus Roizmanbacteria bacterium RIFOXYA2_FULL_41_8]OGK66841.1 MAG: hypothetical protein A2377_02990 [Candidatus Roizmanbacteria bacterium RIFOXYB1_FULL_41_27]OGK70785.1 MAG: hypothetical protein A2403_01715 [Candidatus Roizmanbacteria bacterium RIFOXYC1_FULL_41_16]OGK71423.1 MAG: hypothetical protein A2313_00385 [Candidatus Roizmanbacteria bacterium RIFOXYB2_FULL_41_10]OGK75636.1 MAG: hypothetical protein A2575_02985 [Candidatus Roizmanbacteria bac
MTSELVIYLYNVVEDEWSFISSLSNPIEQAQEIDSSRTSVDTYFLGYANGQNLLFVSPIKISSDFQRYTKNLTNYKNTQVVVPQAHSHLLCLDLINDKQTLEALITEAKKYQKITLISYAATPEFFQLKQVLINKDLNIYCPEAPEIESAWTVNFFGSKSGIRQLAQKSAAVEPDFTMPEGVIVVGIYNAAKIAANKYIKQKGVVIKTNKGSSGNGLLIFRENDLPNDYLSCEQKLTEILKSEPYWERFPIIVEDLISINYGVANGYPNVEFKIHKSGRIEMLYYCSLAVTKDGAFLGIDIHEDIINDRLSTMIVDTGYFVAERLAAEGYRGYFDIDMIAGKNNKIYVCETNTRNTGGTDIYKLVLRLIGKEFMDERYILSRTHYHLAKAVRFEEILSSLKSLLYNRRNKEGLIINSASRLKQQELIYTIIGKNKRRAYQTEQEVFKILKSLN